MKTDIHGFLRACACRGAIQPAMVEQLLEKMPMPKGLHCWQVLLEAATIAAAHNGWGPKHERGPWDGPRARIRAYRAPSVGLGLQYSNHWGTVITWLEKTGEMYVRGAPRRGQKAWRFKAAKTERKAKG